MNQYELRHYYWARSNQAICMARVLEHYRYKNEHNMWYCLMLWAMYKDIAEETANAHSTIAFATAMGISDGIKRAWE